MSKKIIWAILLLIAVIIILLLFICRSQIDKRPPISLTNSSGVETTEFQLHESMSFEAVRLEPRTGYVVQIIREDGEIITQSRLSSDQRGHIPETIIWYDIGILPCRDDSINVDMTTGLYRKGIGYTDYAGRNYAVRIFQDEMLVRELTFQVVMKAIRPTLYAADPRGCPKSGFLIGEEDVWVIGENFPKGSVIKLWAISAKTEWEDADELKDMTKQYHGEQPPIFELRGDGTGFKKQLWPKELTSIGSYDIVSEVITYPFGAYHISSTAQVRNVVSKLNYSGFVIQRRPGVGEPLEMDLAGVRQSQLAYRDAFLTTENVFVGVDPYVHPGYVGMTGDVYIVADKTDADWSVDNTLVDVTGYVESVNIQPGACANYYSTLAWSAPLTLGKYDVVLDFNNNGLYDPGDLIDALDPIGFTVSEVRVNSISFNYTGSGAITVYDTLNYVNFSPPEYVVTAPSLIKPAALVRGGSYSVMVDFKATPAISLAQIWAEVGLGGLYSSGSPVDVSFSGGNGQGKFSINNVPNTVGKHLFYWNWKYQTSTGPADMGSTGEHLVYTVLATPVTPMTIPWQNILDFACTWADGANTNSGVCLDILSNGFSDHYTWNMDCHRLASDFVKLVSTQGITGLQHKWASLGYYGVIDDMAYQKTKAFDPVGPTWNYQQIEWSWHQWAEALGAQRDASAAVTLPGSWRDYEDHLFAQYKRIKNTSPYEYEWVNNQPGQSVGCEAPLHRSYTTPPLYNWRGPDR